MCVGGLYTSKHPLSTRAAANSQKKSEQKVLMTPHSTVEVNVNVKYDSEK